MHTKKHIHGDYLFLIYSVTISGDTSKIVKYKTDTLILGVAIFSGMCVREYTVEKAIISLLPIHLIQTMINMSDSISVACFRIAILICSDPEAVLLSLMKYNVDINSCLGSSPLSLAIHYSEYHIVQMLLAYGAKIHSGWTRDAELTRVDKPQKIAILKAAVKAMN